MADEASEFGQEIPKVPMEDIKDGAFPHSYLLVNIDDLHPGLDDKGKLIVALRGTVVAPADFEGRFFNQRLWLGGDNDPLAQRKGTRFGRHWNNIRALGRKTGIELAGQDLTPFCEQVSGNEVLLETRPSANGRFNDLQEVFAPGEHEPRVIDEANGFDTAAAPTNFRVTATRATE